MSKLPTGGYQPTNRPENLTLPNKGPSYKPKEEESNRSLSTMPETSTKKESRYAVIEWHKYPEDKPKECDEYLVTVNCGYFNLTETSTWKDGLFTDYENLPNKMCSIIAWAEKPEPYKEKTNEG